MKLFDRLLPDKDRPLQLVAVGFTSLIAGLLILWTIYRMQKYGLALFIFIPLFIGAVPVIIWGQKKSITRANAFLMGLLTLAIVTVGLALFAFEGLVCIVMATPITVFLAWIGSLIGGLIIRKRQDMGAASVLLFLAAIPATAFIEKDSGPTLIPVVTFIDINAAPEVVWQHVVEFPQLEAPTEFIFKAGIAYPVNARIEGKGVGAVRYCNFTTGSFVEPVTVWDEPRLLAFDVKEQPAPLTEISFWDIDAPHLHDYFVSKKGQFKLIALPGGKTRLEGTTWYYHHIKPEFYWRLWSENIVHTIHKRVLNHIKTNAESLGK